MHRVAVELPLDIAGQRSTGLVDFGIPGIQGKDCYGLSPRRYSLTPWRTASAAACMDRAALTATS